MRFYEVKGYWPWRRASSVKQGSIEEKSTESLDDKGLEVTETSAKSGEV
jgi:hypothetical protein